MFTEKRTYGMINTQSATVAEHRPITDLSLVFTAETLKRRLTEAETAKYIAMSRAWLRLKRMKGGGPAYFRIGRAIRYDIADLDAWLQAHRVE